MAGRMRWALLALLVLGLLGCAAPEMARSTRPAAATLAPKGASSPASASARPVVTAPPVAWQLPDGWQLLYRRSGFSGVDSVDLRAVGDVMLARNVEHLLRPNSVGWLFEPTSDLLRGDVVIGNLESPFAVRRRPSDLRPGPFRLAADPAFAPVLAPFNALSVANNHALDAGPEALADTYRVLRLLDITPLGLNRHCLSGSAAGSPTSLPVQLLAFNAVVDPQDHAADATDCDRLPLDDAALETVADRRRASGKPVVVMVHWGEEYATLPSDEQTAWAERLVAAGADLILGAHPHVLQLAGHIVAGGRQGFVAYSLGNFVFDQTDRPATSESVVLRAWLDDRGVGAVAAAPVATEGGRPVPLDPQSAAGSAVLARLRAPSASVSPPHAPTPIIRPRSADSSSLASPRVWRWDGRTFAGVPVPSRTSIPPPSTMLTVDLRGDGAPLRATLANGVAAVADGDVVLWRNEAPIWHVEGMTSGDADNDGRFELLIWLWKPDQAGILRSHPFLVGWRGGRYRVFWGGSAVGLPIQAAAIGPVADASRNALVVLEGGRAPGDPADYVAVWTWQGWNFERLWQSERGAYRRLALQDLDGDGVQEIVVR